MCNISKICMTLLQEISIMRLLLLTIALSLCLKWIEAQPGKTDNEGKILLPPEDVINNLAYYLFNKKKQFDRAEDLFAMNIKNHPESFRAYEFLGDLYNAKGNKLRAVSSYKKSLSIKERAETRLKMKKLADQ